MRSIICVRFILAEKIQANHGRVPDHLIIRAKVTAVLSTHLQRGGFFGRDGEGFTIHRDGTGNG